MYNGKALDIWGRGGYHLCNTFASPEEKQAHKTMPAAYAFFYSGIKIIPFSNMKIYLSCIMNNVLKLPVDLIMDPFAIAFDRTPWGLAKTIVDNGELFSQSDGWGFDESLKNTFTKEPYKDFTATDADGNSYTPYKA